MASEAIMAGYMERKTGENSWDRYWHVLRDGCLYCYLREGEEANVCVTELRGYCLYCLLDQIPGKRFVLHLHHADYIPVYLSVDSREELEAWTTSFQKTLADASAQWSDGTLSSGSGQGRELSAAERHQLVKQKLLAEVLRQKQELERQQAARRKKAQAEDSEERETTEEEEEPEEPESPVLQDYSYLTRLKQRRMSTQIKMDALQRQLQPSAHHKRSLFNFGKRKSEEEEARNPYIVQQLQELSERMEQIDSHLEQTQTSPRYPGLPDRGEPRLAKHFSDNRLVPAASSGEVKKFLKTRAGSREDLMSSSSGPRRSLDSKVSDEAAVDARPGGPVKRNVKSSTDLQNGALEVRTLRASADFVDGANSGSKYSPSPVTFTLGPRTEHVNGDWSGTRSLTRSGAVAGSGSVSGHHHTFRTVQHFSADSDERQYSDSASAELSSPGSIPGSPSSSRIGGLKSSLGRLAHRTFGRAGWSLGNKKAQNKGSSSYVASSVAIESDPDSDVFVYDPPPDFIDLTRGSRPLESRVRDTSSSSDDADVTAPISATRAAPVQAGRGFKVSDTSTDPSPPSSSRSSGSCQSPGGPARTRSAGAMGGGAGMVNGHAHPVLDSPRREISASVLAEIEAFERMTQEALAKIPRSKAKS